MAEKINLLWERVQSNEEKVEERKDIIEKTKELLDSPEIQDNKFFIAKLKLILHKCGGFQNLENLAAELELLAKDEPTNLDIWVCLAETLVHDGKPEKAIEPLEFARSISETPDILNLLSLSYRRKTNPDLMLCIELAKKSLKLDMENGKSWSSLGCAFLSLGKPEDMKQAQKAFKMALNKGESTNADVYINLGTVNELLLNYSDAFKNYEEATKITEGWALAQENLSRMKNLFLTSISRSETLLQMKKTKKDILLKKLTGPNQFLFLESPGDQSSPTSMILCLTHDDKIVPFAVHQSFRTYLRSEKTVISFVPPESTTLTVDGKDFSYSVIPSRNDVTLEGGASPSQFNQVKINSSVV